MVAVLLVAPTPGRDRPGRSFVLVGGLIFGLALLSAISTIWSSSVSASLAEFERVVAYLGFFTASYLACRTPKQREWFVRGIAAGVAAIMLLAIGDRLIPGGEPSVAGFSSNRLSFPLDYWNGDGIVFAAGIAFYVWFATTCENPKWRAVSVALASLSCAALYLTYSRGGLLVTACAMILLFFLSDRRLRILGTTVIAAAAAVPALLVITHYPTISGASAGDPSTGESLAATAGILICLFAGALAVEAGLRLARRHSTPKDRALEISRNRRLLTTLAGVGVALLLVLALAFGDQAWDQFTDSDIPLTSDSKTRFTELSGAWRYEFFDVAIDTFADHPVLGTGAGTWPFAWTRERDISVTSHDAHSFYLQNLSDLGIPGGLLSFGLAAALIALAVIARRRRDGPLILAFTAALLLAFGLDWFWRLGATAALLMLLAAWIAGAGPIDRERRPRSDSPGFKVGGLVVAWVAVVVLAVPAITEHYVDASADSVRAGHIDKAVDQARTASKLEPWNPEPHMQLATIAESRGQMGLAMDEVERAIDLEPDNWWAVLMRFQINYASGHRRAAQRDFERLRQMNPVYFGRFSVPEISELGP